MKGITLVILVIASSFCKPKKLEPISLSGLATFKTGKVNIGSKSIELGDKFTEGETISVEPRSSLDFQVITPKTELMIRLKEKTQLLFQRDVLEQYGLVLNLKEGEGLFNVHSPLENNVISFATPSAVLGVRGTKFALRVLANGETQVKLIEGKLSVKPILLGLNTLPKEFRDSKLKLLNDLAINLEAGSQISITPKDSQTLLKSLKLEEIVQEKDPTVLQKKLESWNIQDSKPETWANLLPKPESISEKEKQNWTEEFEELSPIPMAELDKSNLTTETILPRSEKLLQEKLLRLEKKFGKKSQTILLKDGRKFTGILNITEKGAAVISPTGVIELTPTEAEEMEIE